LRRACAAILRLPGPGQAAPSRAGPAPYACQIPIAQSKPAMSPSSSAAAYPREIHVAGPSECLIQTTLSIRSGMAILSMPAGNASEQEIDRQLHRQNSGYTDGQEGRRAGGQEGRRAGGATWHVRAYSGCQRMVNVPGGLSNELAGSGAALGHA